MPSISQSKAYYCTSMPLFSQYNSYDWTSMPSISQCNSYYWTSMPPISHYNSYFWTSMPPISQSGKLLYVWSHPAGLFPRENDNFWKFWTCSFSKKCAFLQIWSFFQGRLPWPNHYAHFVRSEILSGTPVSILKYLSPRP